MSTEGRMVFDGKRDKCKAVQSAMVDVEEE
jgi:hypothetical protein